MGDSCEIITKRKGRCATMALIPFECRASSGCPKSSLLFAILFLAFSTLVVLPESVNSLRNLPVGSVENLKSSLSIAYSAPMDHQLLKRHHRQIRHLHLQHRRHATAAPLDNPDTNTTQVVMEPGVGALLAPNRTDAVADSSTDINTWQNSEEAITSDVWPDDQAFSKGYWVRLAQAKALAIAVENGTLPRQHEHSDIMKPADCRKDHDKLCHDFTTTCAELQANKILEQVANQSSSRANLTYYMTTILHECGFKNIIPSEIDPFSHQTSPPQLLRPQPIFHCNNYKGHDEVLTNFRVQYPTTQLPATTPLHLIPRYFVIELKEGSSRWSLPKQMPVQRWWLFRFKTRPNQQYRVRITAVSPGYVYPPVTSSLLRVYKSAEITVNPPIDLTIVNISLDATASRPQPSAVLRWKSGNGQNASCDFNVWYLDEVPLIKERKTGDEAFWIKLENLHYYRNYTLKVFEKLGSAEGIVETHMLVPSCLAMRGYSFEFCAPPPPTNVHVENATEHSFWVVWDPPKYANSTNRILNYNITVDYYYTPTPPPGSAGSHVAISAERMMVHGGGISAASASTHRGMLSRPPMSSHRLFSGNVPGNQTYFHVSNVTQLRGQFKISVQAVGPVGSSDPIWGVVDYEGLPLTDWSLRKILTLVLAVVGVVVLVSLFCVLKHFHERRQRQKKRQEKFELHHRIKRVKSNDYKNYEKESLQLQHIVERESTKWEIESCNLDLKEGIGKGNFGLVRRAILNQRGKKMTVAVKTLRDGGNEKDVEKLWEEYEILKNLDPHVHVVGLKGIVTKHVPVPLLVVEYCDGGNLQAYLRKVVESMEFSGLRRHSPGSALNSRGSSCNSSIVNLALQASNNSGSGGSTCSARIVTNAAYFMRNEEFSDQQKPGMPTVSIADLLSYARQIAVGMEYLSSNKIVHRDLAARNILISGKSRILKISDFGLSRDVYEQNLYKSNSKGEIPIKWLAIECLLNEIYTSKSDVWSYAILLWEIFTYGGNPYPGVDNIQMFQLLKEGYRMPRPETCPVDLYELMKLCWNDEPGQRPDFTGIRLILEDIIEKTTHVTYLNLEGSHKGGSSLVSHYYKNCADSGFDEYEASERSEPMLPPRNKKRLS